ncbi:CCA tRNA nucleotidyltransferase [Rhodobacteraceae bacterium 2CG4]|uniref:CCA tRNA nucleotidyltransferase n=2 Tax=Halovulum marinum TaxID=2662447 RepID=A0A6L5YZ12_9RHOB|nr:CCA tRNA nucleotidyltransferase [Halovulum marinum]MSU89536.1 CCA tRNA nucleotidyltransferase [Halovulum marinum]
MRMLADGGHQAYFVGGCVRNALLDLPVADIDIATDARPQRVLDLARAAGIKAVPTGVEHGTVTLVTDAPHEVTTFRRDVETDGRRAVVAFSDDMAEDAARRDFTMNALYADAAGAVHDPLGGLPDLRARRVRFIGDAAERIAEDGLRVLRFFRFSAIYGDPAQGLDADGLTAVAAADTALDPVSRERIGSEVVKLLDAADPAPAVAVMQRTGVLERALPGAHADTLPVLVHLERRAGLAPRWQRRLAALGDGDRAAALRLSRADARHLEQVRTCLGDALPDHAAAERFGAGVAEDAALIRAAALGAPLAPDWRAGIDAGAAARFPLKAADLMDRYGPGPALGAALNRLHATWVDSRFTLDKAALLDRDAQDARRP